MPTFITGDELGSIKSVSFTQPEGKEWKSDVVSIRAGEMKTQAIQKMALDLPRRQVCSSLILCLSHLTDITRKLATAHADGSTCVLSLDDAEDELLRWQENRLKESQRFVGLAFSERCAFYLCMVSML